MSTATPAPLAGLLGIEHIGLTVPDIVQAVGFFTEVLGARTLHESGPLRAEDNWMAVNLGVDPRAVIPRMTLLRIGRGPALELFEYEHDTDDAARELAERHPPAQSAVGGSCLAFQVEDIDAGVEALRTHQLIVLGEVKRMIDGPSKGLAWVRFLAPWGQHLQLVSYPYGVPAYADGGLAAGRPGAERDEPSTDRDGALDADPA